MLLAIPEVLTPEQVAQARAQLDAADWADGRITAGYQSAKAKDNAQLPEDSPAARAVGALILDALSRNSTFFSAALPKRIYPPLSTWWGAARSRPCAVSAPRPTSWRWITTPAAVKPISSTAYGFSWLSPERRKRNGKKQPGMPGTPIRAQWEATELTGSNKTQKTARWSIPGGGFMLPCTKSHHAQHII